MARLDLAQTVNERYMFALRSASPFVMLHLKDRHASGNVDAAEMRDLFATGRLWSLWDMLSLNAELFYRLSEGICRTKKLVEQHKNRGLGLIDHTLNKILIDQCSLNFDVCKALGANFSALAILRLQERLKTEQLMFEYVLKSIGDIDLRIKDEFSAIIIITLNSEEKWFFSPAGPLFCSDFEAKFKTDGVFELDEAAKCIAVGRSTAAVFHLMRIMEIGIRAVARCLRIPDPVKPAERNWGTILARIKTGIDQRWPAVADRMHGDGATFEALYASLDAVKNPFRNPTMHIDKKYTDDEAKSIFDMVNGFMNRVASRMDENGDPPLA